MVVTLAHIEVQLTMQRMHANNWVVVHDSKSVALDNLKGYIICGASQIVDPCQCRNLECQLVVLHAHNILLNQVNLSNQRTMCYFVPLAEVEYCSYWFI